MPRRRHGVLVRECHARCHLVRRREHAHVLVLGQCNRGVGLFPSEYRLARAHQRVGERHRAGRGIGPQLTNDTEGLSRLVQPPHAQQQRTQLVVNGSELWLRLDDGLQATNTRRVLLLSNEGSRRTICVDGGILHRHIRRSIRRGGLRKDVEVSEQRVSLLVTGGEGCGVCRSGRDQHFVQRRSQTAGLCGCPATCFVNRRSQGDEFLLNAADIPVVVADQCVHRCAAEPKVGGQRLGVNRLALNDRTLIVEDRT